MTSPPFDLFQAHRWFAIEFNNEAWDLIELPSRTPEQVERAILAVHASVIHWRAVGQPINELRGLLLLASAHLAADRSGEAKEFAKRSVALCEGGIEGLTPFDRASAYGAAASALRLGGEEGPAKAAFARAQAAAAELPADDRAVFDKLYG